MTSYIKRYFLIPLFIFIDLEISFISLNHTRQTFIYNPPQIRFVNVILIVSVSRYVLSMLRITVYVYVCMSGGRGAKYLDPIISARAFA